jgi:gliding motility-associated peptidyl-prolyl isomerase
MIKINSLRILYLSFAILSFLGCKGPEARRPIKVKSGSYFKESIERNKQLLASEEKLIKQIIDKDSLHLYEHSANGSWYYYEAKNDNSDYYPKTDDLVTLSYNLISLSNDTIYAMDEIGVQSYKVDKQDVFPGLRSSVKLLKEHEKATFLFPSSLAYGYHGDDHKIGVNVPLKATISILKIERASQADSIPKR